MGIVSTRFRLQGYVFSDLAKLTHTDITACDKLADWLADKLKKPEPVMKWKVRPLSTAWLLSATVAALPALHLTRSSKLFRLQVLLIMKHVSRGGRAEFRRCLQRHAEAVKGCLRE